MDLLDPGGRRISWGIGELTRHLAAAQTRGIDPFNCCPAVPPANSRQITQCSRNANCRRHAPEGRLPCRGRGRPARITPRVLQRVSSPRRRRRTLAWPRKPNCRNRHEEPLSRQTARSTRRRVAAHAGGDRGQNRDGSPHRESAAPTEGRGVAGVAHSPEITHSVVTQTRAAAREWAGRRFLAPSTPPRSSNAMAISNGPILSPRAGRRSDASNGRRPAAAKRRCSDPRRAASGW